jgi:hypothetical protein
MGTIFRNRLSERRNHCAIEVFAGFQVGNAQVDVVEESAAMELHRFSPTA